MALERNSLVLVAAALLAACGRSGDPAPRASEAPGAPFMKLTSSAFAPGQPIPAEFTCTGANRSPPLAWSDPPPGTKSFALVLEDPDAPNGMFRHWGVYDLPSDRRALAAGDGNGGANGVGAGLAQTRNDFNDSGYGGPCPPPGDKPHRYAFRLLALDIEKLPTPPAQAAGIIEAIDGHVLASADLVGRYSR